MERERGKQRDGVQWSKPGSEANGKISWKDN